jgi:hypothetical protein
LLPQCPVHRRLLDFHSINTMLTELMFLSGGEETMQANCDDQMHDRGRKEEQKMIEWMCDV